MLRTEPRVLYYDLETRPLQAWIWSPGKQYVGHKQLVDGHSRFGIICLTYCWNNGQPAQYIDWGFEEQDTAKIVVFFDELIKSADIVIGKNSDHFDNKMMNAARMFAGLPGNPSWTRYTDDLEKQMRKYFRLPSQSLDYISSQLGLGGKIKMEMQDWIDIVEKNENGRTALEKMCHYGMKDVEDTRTLWNMLSEHFEPKFNVATIVAGQPLGCRHCGSTDLKKNAIKYQGNGTYREYKCKTCKRYAGRSIINKKGITSERVL